ncbi:MAG: replication factor C small subunit [Halobacteriaceae archaeon]
MDDLDPDSGAESTETDAGVEATGEPAEGGPATPAGPAGDQRSVWIEKYRPQRLDDVVGHDDIVERLQSYVDQDDVPHLLFAGQAGVGKTTCAVAIARELYGEDWQQHFMELNASDERGIDVVRDRIKGFARSSFGGADYKIVFLDEADSLTDEAQSALRRTMEQFSNNTRFILSCNYSSQIIDPIQSRCTPFRFSAIPDDAVAERIREVAEAEGIEVTDDGVEAITYVAAGDMRKALNGLQAAAVTGDVVDEEAVYTITSTARPEEVEAMVDEAIEGDFAAARATLDTLLTDKGLAGGDVIDQLYRSVWDLDLDDEAAARLLDRVGEADYRIAAGANERVQLEALLAAVALDGQ